jgi:hypothetical protein
MWCHVMATAVAGCCLTTAVCAQTLQTNSAESAAQGTQLPDTKAARSVSVYGSLNPRPPTSTVTDVTSPGVSVNGANAGAITPFNVGGFTVSPGATEAVYYDDNVFALPSDRLGDLPFCFARRFPGVPTIGAILISAATPMWRGANTRPTTARIR